ncbi:MAG: Ig-like domain-containing protein, partial [Micrococcales bacterium]|nr:Ig-like domain-containing protein [Micrococcales bacterium]
MTPKMVRVLVSGVLVVGLGAVCAPTVGAFPPLSPMGGPTSGGTRVGGVAPPGFATIAAGYYHGYGLDAEGRVWAWGHNSRGQLGNGTNVDSSWPVRVQADAASGPLPRFTAIASGFYTAYGLDESGDIWDWGGNDYHALGNGGTNHSFRPVRLQADASSEPLPRFTAIAGRAYTGYGLDGSGGIWAWGFNIRGQVGDGTTTDSPRPVRVQADAASEPLPRFIAIAAGNEMGYGLDESGGIWAWGSNSAGQLGIGTYTNSLWPVRVQADAASEPLPRFTAITAGAGAGYGLDESGDIWAWGANNRGQLGDGTTGNSVRPARVQADAASEPLPRFAAITGGGDTGFGLDEDGAIWAWGYNNRGQLGNGTTTNSPWPARVQADAASGPLPRFTAITAGNEAGYGLDESGGIWAWGSNSYGQLGDGTTTDSLWPVRSPATVKSVTFDGIAGEDLDQGDGRWSVDSPAGCGPVPVVATFSFGPTGDQTSNMGVFSFGEPPGFTVQPSSGPLLADGQFTASVAVSGDPVPAIQWQSRSWTGAWDDIPGATGSTVTVWPPVGTELRAVATSCWSDSDPSEYTAYSDTAKVTPVTPSPSPSDPGSSASPSGPGSSASPSGPGSSASPSLPPNTSKVNAVGLAMKKLTMKTRTSLKATWMVYPVGVGATLTWSSSKPKVAKVSSSGKITALKPGRAVITAKAEGGKLAKIKVTVVSKAVKAQGVTAVKSGKVKLKIGKTKRLSVQPSPAGSTLKKMPTFRSTKS